MKYPRNVTIAAGQDAGQQTLAAIPTMTPGSGHDKVIEIRRLTIHNRDAADYLIQFRNGAAGDYLLSFEVPAVSSVVIDEASIPKNIFTGNPIARCATAGGVNVNVDAELDET